MMLLYIRHAGYLPRIFIFCLGFLYFITFAGEDASIFREKLLYVALFFFNNSVELQFAFPLMH